MKGILGLNAPGVWLISPQSRSLNRVKGTRSLMAIRNPPRAAGIVGVLLCAFAARAAPAQRDFVFRHENVLGTSLELCIRADSEEAAGSAEARVLAEIDRLAAVRKGSDDTNLIDTISRDPTSGKVHCHMGRQR